MNKLIWIGLAYCAVIAVIDKFIKVFPTPVFVPMFLAGVALMIIGIVLDHKKNREE